MKIAKKTERPTDMQNRNQQKAAVRISGKESGSVLIIVLWISLGLVGIALTFGHSMFMEYKASDNGYAATQAQHTIDGAMQYVRYVIQEQELPGTLIDTDYYPMQELPLGETYFWFLGRDIFSQFTITEPYFNLVDESSKLNLNTATQEMLEMLPFMTPELAARIIDWRDEDDEVTDGGAESNTYELRNPGYPAKNAEFESIEELRFLLEDYPEVLYGEDLNRNGVLDPNENDGEISLPLDNSDGVLDMGILEYLTVYSRLSTTQSDGTARIDVTADDSTELETLLVETFGEERADQLGGGPNADSVLEWYMNSGITSDEFAQIEDKLIAGEEDQIGLININTASEAVLTCIPGIGENGARQIVSYRIANPNSLTSLAWIMEALGTGDDFDEDELGPLITGRSFQYTADVAAVGRNGRSYRRAQIVFDLSEEEPVILYKRDLSGLGWALGQEVREQMALSNAQ